MSASAESGSAAFDTAKLVGAVFILIGGLFAYYYFAEQLLVYRIIGVIASGLVALAVVFTTVMGKTFLGFLREARVEVRKVVWPTRQETVQATLLVVALVFVMGVVLWLLDLVLFWGVSKLTGQGG